MVRRSTARAGTTRVVALDGPSGSGKTTLATDLAAALQPWLDHPTAVVHMDDLYPGWDGLEDAVPRLVEQVLRPLAAGRVARWRRYDWERGCYAEEHDVPPSPVVLVEGVASGSLECAEQLSLLVWVEASLQTRFRRGIERDGEGFRPHWERWAEQEQQHFARSRTRERADVVIDGERDGGWRWSPRT